MPLEYRGYRSSLFEAERERSQEGLDRVARFGRQS